MVAAALTPWSKEVRLSEMMKEFNGGDELVSDDEWQEIAAAAKAENKARFPDGYPESWKHKTNKTL